VPTPDAALPWREADASRLPSLVRNPCDESLLVLVPGRPFAAGEGDGATIVHLADFYLCRHAVCTASYDRFCEVTGHRRRHRFGTRFDDPRAPVVGVSFEDAQAYAAWAGLRLPRELEWEKAAGRELPTGRLGEHAWFRENSGGHPRPLGLLRPNALGLYDMLGNVWEWTDDWYDDAQLYHVVRGGSWQSLASELRPTHRDFNPPVECMRYVGFRCAASPQAVLDATATGRSGVDRT
jgi:formylglycine-generating enzyme required for sulfatase activity